MKGRRRNRPDRVFFKGPIVIDFKDGEGKSLFAIDVAGEPWTLDEGDTFTIDIRNCTIADLNSGQHFIIIPVTS